LLEVRSNALRVKLPAGTMGDKILRLSVSSTQYLLDDESREWHGVCEDCESRQRPSLKEKSPFMNSSS